MNNDNFLYFQDMELNDLHFERMYEYILENRDNNDNEDKILIADEMIGYAYDRELSLCIVYASSGNDILHFEFIQETPELAHEKALLLYEAIDKEIWSHYEAGMLTEQTIYNWYSGIELEIALELYDNIIALELYDNIINE